MSTAAYINPRNAFVRSAELLAVNQNEEALAVIEQTVTNRRFRFPTALSSELGLQEELMLRFLSLCVDMDRAKLAREGLMQFRFLAQSTGTQAAVSLVHRVITSFRNMSEKNLEKIMEANQQEGLPLAPAKVKKQENAARFLFDAYRSILDLFKLTHRMEKLYHETALRAIDACVRLNKSMELRRISDAISTHYTSILRAKPRVKPSGVVGETNRAIEIQKAEIRDMLKPELHLHSRTVLLEANCKLGLWKDACQILEDIHSLNLTVGSEKNPTMAAFVLRIMFLTFLMMLKGNNGLYASYALLSCYQALEKHEENGLVVDPETKEKWASLLCYFALSSPTIATGKYNCSVESYGVSVITDMSERQPMIERKRMAVVLGRAGTTPSRSHLIDLIESLKINLYANKTARLLWAFMANRQNVPAAIFKLSNSVPILIQDLASRCCDDNALTSSLESILSTETAKTIARATTLLDIPCHKEWLEAVKEQMLMNVALLTVSELSKTTSVMHLSQLRTVYLPAEHYNWRKTLRELCKYNSHPACFSFIMDDKVDQIIFYSAADVPTHELNNGVVCYRTMNDSSSDLNTYIHGLMSLDCQLTDVLHMPEEYCFVQRATQSCPREVAAETRASSREQLLLSLATEKSQSTAKWAGIKARKQAVLQQLMQEEHLQAKMAEERGKTGEELIKSEMQRTKHALEQQKRVELVKQQRLIAAGKLIEALKGIASKLNIPAANFLLKNKNPLSKVTAEEIVKMNLTYADIESAERQILSKTRQSKLKTLKADTARLDWFVNALVNDHFLPALPALYEKLEVEDEAAYIKLTAEETERFEKGEHAVTIVGKALTKKGAIISQVRKRVLSEREADLQQQAQRQSEKIRAGIIQGKIDRALKRQREAEEVAQNNFNSVGAAYAGGPLPGGGANGGKDEFSLNRGEMRPRSGGPSGAESAAESLRKRAEGMQTFGGK